MADFFDEEDEELNEMLDELFGPKKGPTDNYYISCLTLRNLFFVMDFTEDEFRDDKETGKSILFISLKFALEHGVMVPRDYIDLPVTFIANDDYSKFGYVIEFFDATKECDCRFVGMMYENGKRKYYTAEYYEYSDTCGFCSFDENGDHSSYSNTVESFEDFKNAILG